MSKLKLSDDNPFDVVSKIIRPNRERNMVKKDKKSKEKVDTVAAVDPEVGTAPPPEVVKPLKVRGRA